MKLNLTAGYLFLLGLPALAIEAPGTSTPIPPQPTTGQAHRSAEPVAPPASPTREEDNTAPSGQDDAAPSISDIDDGQDNNGFMLSPELGDSQPAPARAAASAYLGIGGAEVPDILAEHLKLGQGQGLVIRTLDPESPAAKAGLATNDVITRIDGKSVGSHEELRELMSAHKPGDDIAIDFIDKGDAKTVHATLASNRAARSIADTDGALDQLMLQGIPADQAQRIRDAVERNLRAFDHADRDLGRQADAAEQMQRGIQERIQRMMGSRRGIELKGGIGGAGPNGMSFKSSSSIKLLDDKGSIELRSEDDSKTVRALDKTGKVQWEGPYNNDEDKKAMPEDVRDRVEKLSPDLDFKGNGFRLNLGPRR